MELIAIEKSAMIRLAIFGRSEGQVNIAELVRAVRSNFAFDSGPESLANTENGIEFQHGEINGVALNRLGLYRDGVVLQSAGHTRHLDETLEFLSAWVAKEFGFSIIETHAIHRMYESNIVIRPSPRFLTATKKFAKLQRELQDGLKDASGLDVLFGITAFGMSPDLQGISGMKPTPFKVARHTSADFSSNLFQSSAPLATDRHIKALEVLEEISL